MEFDFDEVINLGLELLVWSKEYEERVKGK